MTDAAGLAVVHEVEQFLYREARLLDERRWSDWLSLWTDDAWLTAPTSEAVASRTGEVRLEAVEGATLHWFDEPVAVLAMRVQKMESGWAWSEVPPSHTRRLISNVELTPSTDDELHVRSNLLLYRQRGTDPALVYAAHRQDVLRRDGGTVRIARRKVMLDVGVLPSGDLTFFL